MAGLAAGVVVVGGLAGCTGGPDEPSWTPTVWTPEETVEPSPTPTPTPDDPAAIPPERPAAMDTGDTAGAEAFATYFIELFPYVFATGDVDAFRAHSHPECVFCTDVIATAEAQTGAGGHSEGGLIDIQEVTALEIDPGKWWGGSVEMVQAAVVDIDRDGNVVTEVAETAYHVDLAIVRENGIWLMREVSHEEKS